ncbi:hypothetical protein [Alicyclobacillus shizuokensis]|uniref:hypothetical protein n=1 Tax=Alicyclobacillus shizuokensis TaxID=392014 RepID=UPI000831FC27|nr:hypothetical protein [Alicyclobacillus shizuokensis]
MDTLQQQNAIMWDALKRIDYAERSWRLVGIGIGGFATELAEIARRAMVKCEELNKDHRDQ